jgi:hypothetical protein
MVKHWQDRLDRAQQRMVVQAQMQQPMAPPVPPQNAMMGGDAI